MSEEFPSELKRKKRSLSRFLARELLYDYADGLLDEERKNAVENFLETDGDTRRELEDIRSAIEYCHQLEQTAISEHLMAQLKDHRNALRVTRERLSWNEWPALARWTVEALAVAAVVATLAVLIPRGHWRDWWPDQAEKVVLLQEQDTKTQEPKSDSKLARAEGEVAVNSHQEPVKSPVSSPEAAKVAGKVLNQTQPVKKEIKPEPLKAANDKNEKAESPDQTAEASSQKNSGGTKKAVERKVAKGQEDKKASLDSIDEKSKIEKVKRAEPMAGKEISSGTEKQKKSTEANATDDAQEALAEDGEAPAGTSTGSKSADKAELKGFVYRVFMDHTELDKITPEIAEEIKRLGGQKAGRVELGWRKPKGSYFHFSLDKDQYDAVVEMLRTFGPVRISKDPHRRVMPDGKIRFILWIEDISIQ